MADNPQTTTEASRARGHEPNRFSVNFVVFSGIGIAAVIAIAMWLMSVLFSSLGGQTTSTRPVIPEDASDPSHRQELHRLIEAEETILHEYAWIDEQAGIARVPIDRAMEILVNEQVPACGEQTESETEEAR